MGGRSGGRSEENRNKRMEKDGGGYRGMEAQAIAEVQAIAPQMMMITAICVGIFS
jgi:hypothetical protein